MKFYIQDVTKNQFVYFGSVPEVVEYLDGMLQRAEGVDRTQYMQNLIDLGYGFDDPQGVTFTRSLKENLNFNVGAVMKNGEHRKCDIHNISSFDKEEFGD